MNVSGFGFGIGTVSIGNCQAYIKISCVRIYRIGVLFVGSIGVAAVKSPVPRKDSGTRQVSIKHSVGLGNGSCVGSKISRWRDDLP